MTKHGAPGRYRGAGLVAFADLFVHDFRALEVSPRDVIS